MLDWPQRIVLVRHGQSEGNAALLDDNSFCDKANYKFSLTQKGQQEARRAGSRIREKFGPFDGYFCSTFKRSQETLLHMYPGITPIPMIDARLNELWRGIWHTMSKEDVRRLYPREEEIRQREGEYHYRPPGGQNVPDLEVMIHSFLLSLRIEWTGKAVLVLAHGNWMLAFWRIVLNRLAEDFEQRYQKDKYKNGAYAWYENIHSSLILQEDNVSYSYE